MSSNARDGNDMSPVNHRHSQRRRQQPQGQYNGRDSGTGQAPGREFVVLLRGSRPTRSGLRVAALRVEMTTDDPLRLSFTFGFIEEGARDDQFRSVAHLYHTHAHDFADLLDLAVSAMENVQDAGRFEREGFVEVYQHRVNEERRKAAEECLAP